MSREPLSEQERYRLFWREVAYQAVRDLLCPELEKASEADRATAYEWVYGERTAIGSFAWACAEGGVDAEALRSELRKRGIG